MADKQKIAHRISDHFYQAQGLLDDQGLRLHRDYEFEGIHLQGSQNYGTDHEDSDVDTKLIITPTYQSLLRNRKFNKTLVLENGEHCDVRTAEDYVVNVFKGNINWIEGLYTDHHINAYNGWWTKLKAQRDTIVEHVGKKIVSAAYGMAQQKQASLFKSTVTTQPFFDQHGYDNKNLIHAVRLADFVEQFCEHGSFGEALKFSERGSYFMAQVRGGDVTKDQAVLFVAQAIAKINEHYHDWDKPELNAVELQKEIVDEYVDIAISEA